jgi:hypothetical protein
MRYRNHRWPSDRSILVHVGGRQHLATLRNVNLAGLCVSCDDDQILPGNFVRFSVSGLTIGGRVIWVRSGRVGVKFDAPIGNMQLALIRSTPFSPSSGHRLSVAGYSKSGFCELR